MITGETCLFCQRTSCCTSRNEPLHCPLGLHCRNVPQAGTIHPVNTWIPLSDPHYRSGSLIAYVTAAASRRLLDVGRIMSSARSGIWAARRPVQQDRRLSNQETRVRHQLVEDIDDDNKRLRPSDTA